MVTRQRCDNCGRRARKLFPHGRFQGRTAMVCGHCVERLARSRAMVERATRRRAA